MSNDKSLELLLAEVRALRDDIRDLKKKILLLVVGLGLAGDTASSLTSLLY